MKIPTLSAQQHRHFDQFALPGLLAFAAYMVYRNKTAAVFASLLMLIEGTGLLTTDYPPGILPWLSFRDHVTVGLLTPWVFAAAACLSKDLPVKERNIILPMTVVSLLVNGFSEVESLSKPRLS